MHGASHHAPQVFQVATSRSIKVKRIGRPILHFYHRDNILLADIVKKESRTGIVLVSSIETTILDTASDIGYVGCIDNAANLIIELCEALKPDIDVINIA